MDIGGFADEVLDVVANLCGDTVVETHEQASHVLEALVRRPGANMRELAAVFGLSFETLERTREIERARSEGEDERLHRKNPVWSDMCKSEAVYTWNVLIERINQAAHWREEFRDLVQAVQGGDESDVEDFLDDASIGGSETEKCPDSMADSQVASATRVKARAILERHLEPADEELRKQLAKRLDCEIVERYPTEKEYRRCARGLGADFKRNPMLSAGYATGRVPPQWVLSADFLALAPRLRQFQRRIERAESCKEALQDCDIAEIKSKMYAVGMGHGLQDPAEFEDVV